MLRRFPARFLLCVSLMGCSGPPEPARINEGLTPKLDLAAQVGQPVTLTGRFGGCKEADCVDTEHGAVRLFDMKDPPAYETVIRVSGILRFSPALPLSPPPPDPIQPVVAPKAAYFYIEAPRIEIL